MFAAHFIALIPELMLALGSLSLLMVGVFKKKESVPFLFHLTLCLLGIVVIVLFMQDSMISTSFFSGHFIQDSFSQILKITILIVSFLVLAGTKSIPCREGDSFFEYPILILFALLGMMMMVSAQSFFTLFMGLELQSLSLYIITSIRRDNVLSSEAGMKYFILGALSTGMLLYGISFIYGATGTVSFEGIHTFLAAVLADGGEAPMGLMIGFLFVLAGIAFKISLAPFHMWTPDVYEGAPSFVTVFLATVPKIAAFAMLPRVLMSPFVSLAPQWIMPLMMLSILSMGIGFFGLLMQGNLKRLIAYSSIANGGFALIGLLPGTVVGVQGMLIYFILYGVTILGFFFCILLLSKWGKKVDTIDDLSGLSKIYPGLSFIMILLLFSLAGVPPLAGFLGKLYIFKVALQSDYLLLSGVALVTSVVGAAYYLWIIKKITMDPAVSENWVENRGKGMGSFQLEDTILYGLIILITVSIMVFFLKPNFLVDIALQAATSVFHK